MNRIGFVQPKGSPAMSIFYDALDSCTPYKVYLEFYDTGKYGYPTRRKKLVVKYSDLASCGCVMSDYMREHNEERR